MDRVELKSEVEVSEIVCEKFVMPLLILSFIFMVSLAMEPRWFFCTHLYLSSFELIILSW